jgi:hypothetical protein
MCDSGFLSIEDARVRCSKSVRDLCRRPSIRDVSTSLSQPITANYFPIVDGAPVISARRRKKPALRGELIVQSAGMLW